MQVNIRHQVSPYFLFFIIIGAQTGVGILGFHRIIAKDAGYDAWISVLIAGAIIQLIMAVMIHLLSSANGDIVDVHNQLYGKTLGSILSGIIMFYFWLAAVSVLREYIEIIQVWMFPTLPTWVLALLILTLCYYIISGGFRVVAGICFVAVIYTFLLFFNHFYLPRNYIHIDNVLPILDHTFVDLLRSAKETSYSMAGFEIILMVFPFIKNARSSQKFAHLGIAFTTLFYTVGAFTTFLFISEKQIQTTIWARININTLTTFSFIQRIEYILASLYLIKIVTIITLMLWASSRGFKKIFKKKQKAPLLVLMASSLVLCQLLDDRYILHSFLDMISGISLGLFYLYIPLLWLFYIVVKKKKRIL
ncbi:GerAB/ArcD/ProY family transporter [Fictibacillus sp. 7GRE50]|uniref:GerAB/ArcD/ProY family transporter n=1 Tax=unclassified Fictibacillus TaxID=2644029 RepID=UPI0018CF5E8D|nr:MULTISPECIES: GerAB/ArcD/ProY family transporter [unclassified Fictibacillus]MBH0164849.1 GerAB/ArcD/ProY family transporter [Fictibacillus sp. 7GRE50]MBH0172553.1 GerAB/ArcD/ProY family transporter [Fictibacillus sp. 23RED33]